MRSGDKIVDYATGWVGDEYKCIDCGVHGIKLWRIAACSCIQLRCIDCVGKKDNIDVSDVDENGTILDPDFLIRTDQIGSMLSAIPDEFKIYYGSSTIPHISWWQYTCVPQAGIDWWEKLPLRR